jgi:pimeloyl-ACP methyl ester carboxylesterase
MRKRTRFDQNAQVFDTELLALFGSPLGMRWHGFCGLQCMPISPIRRSVDLGPDAFESLEIVAGGIVWSVTIAGPADAPPVLLLHGLGWDRSLWQGLASVLARGGWRVVAPDLPGMGASQKLVDVYSIDHYAADLATLLRELRIGKFAVVGFSLGGMIAMALAAAAYDQVGAAVFACCLKASTPKREAETEAMLARAEQLGALAFAGEQAQAIWSADWARLHPDRVRDFVNWRASMNQTALAQAFRASYGADLTERLKAVTCPARVIAAANDPFAPVQDCDAIACHLPRGDFILLSDCGHMAPIEQPQAFEEAVVAFLMRAFPTGAIVPAIETVGVR